MQVKVNSLGGGRGVLVSEKLGLMSAVGDKYGGTDAGVRGGVGFPGIGRGW